MVHLCSHHLKDHQKYYLSRLFQGISFKKLYNRALRETLPWKSEIPMARCLLLNLLPTSIMYHNLWFIRSCNLPYSKSSVGFFGFLMRKNLNATWFFSSLVMNAHVSYEDYKWVSGSFAFHASEFCTGSSTCSMAMFFIAHHTQPVKCKRIPHTICIDQLDAMI